MKYISLLFLLITTVFSNTNLNKDEHFLLAKKYYEIQETKNDEKAFYHFKKAAMQNHIEALFMTGKMYYTGQGVEKNSVKALEIHKKLIESADVKTMKKLLLLYESLSSNFIKQNKKALEKRLLELNDSEFNCELARSYYKGLFTKRDLNKALNLFEQEAKNKQTNCVAFLSRYYFFKKDYDKAIIYTLEDAKTNNPYSLERLALSYENGYGIKKDINKANEIYKKLLATNNKELALKKLPKPIKINLDEKDPKNYKKFVEAFNKKDYENSLKYALFDAKENNYRAQYNVALHYEHAFGVPRDLKEAFYWYEKSANQNFHKAILKVAQFYYYANGVKKDKQKALILFRKASLLGNQEAKKQIKHNYRRAYIPRDKKVSTYTSEVKELYKKVRNERKQKEYYLALQSYKKLYSLGQNETILNIANIYKRFKDEKAMIYYYNLAFEKHQLKDAAYELHKYYLYEKHDYKKAVSYLEQAYDEKRGTYGSDIAMIYGKELQDFEKMIFWYKKVIKLNSGFDMVKLDTFCAYNNEYKCLDKIILSNSLK